MNDNSGEFRVDRSWWSEHGGKIAASMVAAFLVGAGAWAVQMDRQSVRIGMSLEQIQVSLVKQSQKLDELNQLEKRVTRIEDNRFTDSDAKVFMKKCEGLDSRIRTLEDRVRRRR